jgi:DNA-binding PadR family transcriptional regulator
MKRRPPETSSASLAANDPALTPAQFHILLTLAEGNCHGYAIMREIERRTGHAVELGPGTLYRSIKQLLARGLITEVAASEEAASEAERRRRSYALTPAGRIRTVEEARRLKALVRWAEEAMVLEGGSV